MKRRILGWVVCVCVFCTYIASLCVLGALHGSEPARRRRRPPKGLRVLITGRFDSLNWCRSHLLPLAQTPCIGEILTVVNGPTISHPKVRSSSVPPRLVRLLGRPIARSAWAVWLASRWRPDVIIGYHFFPAGLSALLGAGLTGARAVYQMTGGPIEVIGGGVATENPLLPEPTWMTRRLQPWVVRLCRYFDTVIVRGGQARQFLLARSAARRVDVIPGSVDLSRFSGVGGDRTYDVAFVGRLVPVKRPERVLHVAAAARQLHPGLRVVVVGDGPLMAELQDKAKGLGLEDTVAFLGHQEKVEDILHKTKVFLLTSRSEGLSIAMAEAMAAGAVPVVADVGELADLVRNGETGWRVPQEEIEAYARHIVTVLADDPLRQRLSAAARQRASEYNSLEAVVDRWQRCLAALSSGEGESQEVTAKSLPPGHSRENPVLLFPTSRYYRIWNEEAPWWIKYAAARAADSVPPRYRLGYRVSANVRFVQRAERWPLDRARAYQLKRLQRLCALAYEKSVHYRRCFREVGFSPEDLKCLEDFARLPTIDRDTLREHLLEMCTVAPRSPYVDYAATGGTSGVPLEFYIDADRSTTEYAYLTMSWRRVGYEAGTPLAVLRGRVVGLDRTGLRHEYDPLLRHHYYSVFHMTDENMRRYLEHIATIGPCFLHVYPSTVAALARFMLRSGIKAPANIRGVISESEIVYPEQRRIVESVFGCRYFSCYGHSEKLVMAAECERSADYHVWPTYGYFELLDEHGRPVTTPGACGEIVGTGFINTAVPFIRYRTGDYAVYVGDHCEACGRSHVLIRDIRGHRTQEVLVASDGSQIPWAALNMHDDTFAHVRQFQFHQEVPGRAVLKVVPAERFGDDDCQRILRNVGRKVEGRLDFTIEITDAIPLSPRGKAIYVQQMIPSAAL